MRGRATQIWRTAASWKLGHQDEKVHVGTGTIYGAEKLEPEDTSQKMVDVWKGTETRERERAGQHGLD